MICNKKDLAKTSVSPGKTKLINHFEIKSSLTPSLKGEVGRGLWYLVDLPGYGFAVISKKARNNWSNMIESYIRKRENLACLFVLIDSRREPQTADLELINQLGEWQTAFVLVFTKADKNKPGATAKNVKNFLEAMAKTWEEPPPYFVTSTISKEGRKPLLDYIAKLNSRFKKL